MPPFPSFSLFNRIKIFPWDTPWGQQNAGDLREPPAWAGSPLAFCIYWRCSNIWISYQDILWTNWDPAGTWREPWSPWSLAHTHCWWLTRFWDQLLMCIPFPCARGFFFPPGALSSVGCQRTCQEEKIPCWCKSRSSPGQWRVCSVLGWEGLGVTQNSGSVSPSHTKNPPWTLSTNSINSI